MTDPVFSAWFGIPILRTPWSFGVKRIHKPQLRIHDLPAIDIIVLSHSHMDHLHPYSCKKIVKHSHDKTQIIVAP